MFFSDAIAPIAKRVLRILGGESQPKTFKGKAMLESKEYAFSAVLNQSQTEWITDVAVSLPMFTIGNLNIVEWDGKEYECPTYRKGGNPRYVAIGDGDYPFDMRLDTQLGRMLVTCYTDKGYEEGTQLTHTFAVYNTETIHPISDKYLPAGFGGGGLPVVELTTQIPNDGSPVQFTAEENEAFEKAALSGMPAVIRFTFSPDGNMVVQMASIGSRLEMYIEVAGQMCGFRVHTDAETNFVFEGLNGHWGGRYMPTA